LKATVSWLLLFMAVVLLPPAAPARVGNPAFETIGLFSVRDLGDGSYRVTDGIGRELYLVPRGAKAPAGATPDSVVRIPVKRVVTVSGRDTSLIKALDSIETVVGVTGKVKDWLIPEIAQGLKSKRVSILGTTHSIDFERLAAIRPDVLFTWDESLIPKLSELNIPVVITSGGVARDLDTQVRFVRFLAPFFGKFDLADAFVDRVRLAIDRVRRRTKQVRRRPKVIWGDIYSKRVLVEPGNSWAAEVVKLGGGEYLYRDVKGIS